MALAHFKLNSVSMAALIVSALALGGCPKVEQFADGGGDVPVKGKIGNALGFKMSATCSEEDKCESVTLVQDLQMGATVTESGSGETKKASVAVTDAKPEIVGLTNVPYDSAEGAYYSLNNVTGDEKVITKNSPEGVDDFFFFTSVSDHFTSETTGELNSVIGTGGNKTEVAKLKTATFKGQGAFAGVKRNATGDTSGFAAQGNLLLNADITAGKVSGTISGLQADTTEENPLLPELAGGALVLKEGEIVGADFGNGSLMLKNAQGGIIVDMNGGQSNYVGSFYGEDMDYAAGVLQGSGVNSASDIYTLFGAFWGEKSTPEPSSE